MPASPRIVVLSTGGTIASVGAPGGAVPVLDADDLLAGSRVDGAPIGAVITARSVCSVDSAAMTSVEHRMLQTAVAEELADSSVTGVVITHGTDTLEETAALLDLTHDDPRPVVLTGAQFPSDSPNSDGPGNLTAALRCALDLASRDRGVLIAFADRVLPARGVFKTSTTSTAAFDVVHGHLARPTLPALPAHAGPSPARVDIVALYPGVDASIIGTLIDAGATGLVLAGLGSGNAHPTVTRAVRDASDRGVPVVISSRVPHGELAPTYGGGGGAVDLVTAGGIVSPWLRPPQARVVLSELLSRGADHAAVADFFAAGGPIS